MTYLTHIKALLVEALEQTFDEEHPIAEFRGLRASIEYPVQEMHYPGIWVDYEDADALSIVGIDHTEYVERDDGEHVLVTRWKFSGYASFTVTALTSLERDRIYDELVNVFAFGRQDTRRGRLKRFIEDNPFIATTWQWDTIQPRGNVAAPGTPWGTDEIIYERSINIDVMGEFVPDPDPYSPGLINLSDVKVSAVMVLPGENGDVPVREVDLGPTGWH